MCGRTSEKCNGRMRALYITLHHHCVGIAMNASLYTILAIGAESRGSEYHPLVEILGEMNTFLNRDTRF